jgi:hypothetical protein
MTFRRVRVTLKRCFVMTIDKSVPEEDIGRPTGLDLEKKNVGNNSPCSSCVQLVPVQACTSIQY